MKVSNIKQMQRLDPDDIREANGTVLREVQRKKLITNFLWWSLGQKDRWNSINNEERIVVKRQYAYVKALSAFAIFTNFAIYNCFLTGIYNLRNLELADMRRVPFAVKFTASTAISLYFSYKLFQNNIYEAELYEVAVRYRNKYDKKYIDTLVGSGGTGL